MTLKQACTSFTGPPQRSKLLSQPFLLQAWTCFTSPARRFTRLWQVFPTNKQACMSFRGHPQWCKLPSSSFLTIIQFCRSLTGPPQHSKLLSRSWYLNRPARASPHILGGENGNCTPFPHLKRLIRVSQDLHSGENCFIDLSYRIHWFARASQQLLGG